MISKETMAKILGRPLSSIEDANYTTYLNTAVQTLDLLLGLRLESSPLERTYLSKIDMSEVFVDPFTSITSVTINGDARTDYTIKQNDYYSADWYNVLEFDDTLNGEKVVVKASWGFDGCPSDLEQLVGKLFVNASAPTTNNSDIKRKTIEDFSVEYFSNDSFIDTLKRDYALVIAKYSNRTGYLLHGGDNVI